MDIFKGSKSGIRLKKRGGSPALIDCFSNLVHWRVNSFLDDELFPLDNHILKRISKSIRIKEMYIWIYTKMFNPFYFVKNLSVVIEFEEKT